LAELKAVSNDSAQAYQLHNGESAYAYGAGSPDVASLALNLNISFFITSNASVFNDFKEFFAKKGVTAYLEDSGLYALIPVGGTSASSQSLRPCSHSSSPKGRS
jgi:hypothetical protein